jgi:hypothetical protein
MEFRKSGPFVSMNLEASIDDDLSDPIVEEEAKRVERELAKKMLKQSLKLATGGGEEAPLENEAENAPHLGIHSWLELVKNGGIVLSLLGASTDSDGAEFGPFQGLSGGSSSCHVISSPYELSHYPIEILENKTALQRQISNRLATDSALADLHNILCLAIITNSLCHWHKSQTNFFNNSHIFRH